MTVQDEIKTKRDSVLQIAEKFGVYNVRLFGSCVHHQETSESDIDFLINIHSDRSLMDLVGFQQDLEDLFKRPIDVVTEKGLHWVIRDDVLKEALPI